MPGTVIKYICLAAYAVCCAAHLYASFVNNKKLRAKTKWPLLLLLAGFYASGNEHILIPVLLAIFFAWLGDVLLIPHGVLWFTFGGISFMASHFCLVYAYQPNIDFSAFPAAIHIIVPLVYLIAVCIIFSGLVRHLKKPLIFPMFAYLLINAFDNTFAFFQLISRPCFGTAIIYAGTILFFISDSCLFYCRFKTHTFKRNHFIVMLTYVLAELFIVFGLMCL